MKKKTKDAISNYEKACNNVADLFAQTYFEKPYVYWVGDDIGEVIGINDYFFSIDDMLNYLKNNATSEELFEHYNYVTDCNEKGLTKHTFKYFKHWRVTE